MRVVIAGGGTAGHAYPALAVAEVLRSRGIEVVFVGTIRGPESHLARDHEFRFEAIDVSGRSGSPLSIRNLRAGAKLVTATARSILLMGETEPEVVVTTGGYVGLPVALAAAIQRIPIVVHEQNTVPGLANRIASRFARSVGVAFEETMPRFGSRARLVGNPVRAEIARPADARDQAVSEFGLAPGRRTLLVMGGSQGARSINDVLFDAYDRWRRRDSMQVLHLVGRRNAEEAEKALTRLRGPDDRVVWRLIGYTERMDLAYAIADLVVCRAGATTIFELAASGVPAILVPYPHSIDDDQLRNARAAEATGGAEVIVEPDLGTLANHVEALLDDEEARESMSSRIKSLHIPDAAERLADLIEETRVPVGAGARNAGLSYGDSSGAAGLSTASEGERSFGPDSGAIVPWRRVHMVGIGGAGMSAIARVLHQAGITVTGSDLSDSAILARLSDLGMRVDAGHSAGRTAGADVVIASAAVGEDNIEIAEARGAGIDVVYRGEALAELVRSRRVIAVSGTHGKTTTSGMVATILETAGLDATHLLGADLTRRGPGGKLGKGDLAVVEADEAYGSFLALKPHLALLTNIDADHLDFFGSMDGVRNAFREFVAGSDHLIVCIDDAEASAIEHPSRSTYGLREDAEVTCSGLVAEAHRSTFLLEHGNRIVGEVVLQVAGRRNVQNALGAAAAALSVGVADEAVVVGLGAFEGLSRRFEFRGSVAGADLIDDYGHHPTEIDATLTDARSGPWERIVAVFQPHLYSRTQSLSDEFGKALAQADLVVVTEIYGAREAPIPGVSGKLVAEAACEAAPNKRVAYLPRLDEAVDFVRDVMRPGDLVLALGAGDITELSDRLLAGIS